MKVGARLTVAGATGLFSIVIFAGAAFATGGSVLVPDVPGQVLQTHGVGAVTASQNAASKSLKTTAIASGLSSLNITLVRAGDAVVVGAYPGSADGASRASNSGKLHSEFGLNGGTPGHSDESHGNSTQIPETPRVPSLPTVPTAPAIPGNANIQGTPPASHQGSGRPDNLLVNQENGVHDP